MLELGRRQGQQLAQGVPPGAVAPPIRFDHHEQDGRQEEEQPNVGDEVTEVGMPRRERRLDALGQGRGEVHQHLVADRCDPRREHMRVGERAD